MAVTLKGRGARAPRTPSFFLHSFLSNYSMLRVLMALVLMVASAPAAYAGEGPVGETPPNSLTSGMPPEAKGTPPPLPKGGLPLSERVVTPYGDFCPRCSKYGMGRMPVKHRLAVEAVRDYFGHKGLRVKSPQRSGRFLRFDIYRDDRLVDKIIFDRMTGRIRSIY